MIILFTKSSQCLVPAGGCAIMMDQFGSAVTYRKSIAQPTDQWATRCHRSIYRTIDTLVKSQMNRHR